MSPAGRRVRRLRRALWHAAAPRRPARGRADDLLFITVQVQASGRVPPGMLDHLAQSGADVFYRTPGSVTSALREVMLEVGDELANAGRAQEPAARYLGRVVAAVIRDDNLYMAQCGPGQMTLVRGGQVSHLSSPRPPTAHSAVPPTPSFATITCRCDRTIRC